MSFEMIPDEGTAMAMMRGALAQIDFARRYTRELLDATPRNRWYETPSGAPNHIAWQVGHLTVSQYGLLMFRIHGRRDSDLDLVPSKFRKTFARGSDPAAQASKSMTPEELLERFDLVYQQALAGLHDTQPSTLLEPVDMPYAGYPIKLGAILFCPLHEQIHAGQIGLIRRLMGLSSIR